MKKVLLIVLVLLAVGAVGYRAYSFFLSSGLQFGTQTIAGSGNIKTESRTVVAFNAIDLRGIGHASIARTGTPSLSISADDNLLPLIVSEVKDGILHLSFKNGTNVSSSKIEYRITVADLGNIDLSGAATLQAAGLDGKTLTITLSGASRATISGRADSLTADVSGASGLNAAALQVKRANVEASGASQISVNVSDALDADASGASNIRYQGRPRLTSNTSGAGTVRPGS